VRPYEVMMIIDTGAEAPAIQSVVERALETIQAHGGTPGTVDRWGRRPFAYEVKHRREGYYVLVEFGGEVRTVDELDRMLSLADEVIRHKVVRVPEKAVKRPGASMQGSRRQEAAGPVPAVGEPADRAAG
jgi:small subunit ribosomal protein S6